MKQSQINKDSFILAKDLAKLLGTTKVSIWRRVRSGRIPQPIKLSTKVCFWRRADLKGLLESGGERPACQ